MKNINAEFENLSRALEFDIILSDMAVNTTGNKTIDSIVTGELTIEALHFSEQFLLKNCQFVSKINWRASKW